METYLINNNSDKLITFLTGWGCDFNQFKFMKNNGGFDILLCYDYSDLNLNFDFSVYKKHYLITFSAGVFIAGIIKDKLPKFEKTIAINGNPLSYDEYYGLRKEIIDVFMGVSKENALDFRRKYLVFDDNEFKLFNANQSHRTFDSCKEELNLLVSCINKDNTMHYDVAVLSMNDKIFNPAHQSEYWSKMPDCRIVKLENTAHFPFFKLNNYDEITEL